MPFNRTFFNPFLWEFVCFCWEDGQRRNFWISEWGFKIEWMLPDHLPKYATLIYMLSVHSCHLLMLFAKYLLSTYDSVLGYCSMCWGFNSEKAIVILMELTVWSGKLSQTDKHINIQYVKWCCCCSVTQLCPTLCNPMDCSTPGFLVLHYLQSLLKCMSIELVMPSNHLILCHPLLLLPSIFPSIRVLSNELALCIR